MKNTALKLLLIILMAGILLPVAATGQSSATKRKVSHRVVPEYPQIARQMSITGKVKLEAVVEPDGHVKVLARSAAALLIQAASRALKEWKFAAGPKETTEIVEFDFTGQQ